MGCKGNVSGDTGCGRYTPPGGEGVSFEFREYPEYAIRGGTYNIPERDANAVMYPSLWVEDPQGGHGTHTHPESACGKLYTSCSQCGPTNNKNGRYYYEYYPKELSFDFALSDTWFSYLYDTSDDAGVAGKPCFYLEDDQVSVTTSDGADPPTTSTTTDSGSKCIPCAGFTCTPEETDIKYSGTPDLTGDPDCPHPTLFGIGTKSDKLVYKYDALATTVPNAVPDFSFSYDGTTYTDVFQGNELEGITYESTQNPWQQADADFFDFHIFEINSGSTKTGFRIKVEITPKQDSSGATPVFSGTNWKVTEMLSGGTGYAVNDTFALSYTLTHADNTTTTLTMNLKVTQVGSEEIAEGQAGFDVLRPGDTINGHTITRTFHTDMDNFLYHIVYLDGTGSNFTKDTQYTSNRSHVITAKAGYGIVDRACLIGLYEFLDKSVQFITADLDKSSPDTLTTMIQPTAEAVLTNGRITGITITDGGKGWNELNKTPVLEIGGPLLESGEHAKIEGTFTNGVLTAVQIINPGSGYGEGDSLPRVWVRNIFSEITTSQTNEGFNPNRTAEFQKILNDLPEDPSGEIKVTKEVLDAVAATEKIGDEDLTKITNTEIIDKVVIKKDPDRDVVYNMPQTLYDRASVEGLKEFKPNYPLDHLPDTGLDAPTQKVIVDFQERIKTNVDKQVEEMIEDPIPTTTRYDDNLVETIQGSLTQLPYASEYTKYIMRQYRPDPSTSTKINVELSCKPVNEGCAHFSCSTPASTPNSSETVGNVTTVHTYTMQGIFGSGCQSWKATGKMKIFNDLTRSAARVEAAAVAYGNPYDTIEVNS